MDMTVRPKKMSNPVAIKLGFHIHVRGKHKRLAAAASGYGMRYANDLIPYIGLRLPMRLHSLFLSE